MPGDGPGVAAQPLERPLAPTLGIRHGLERREGLRGHDEERLRRVEVANRLGEIGAVDVGHEPEGHRALAVVLEGLVGHDRPQVGAADPDVDDALDAPAGVARPGAAPDPVGEVGHLVEHGMNLGHHVQAVHDDGGFSGSAQGDVQYGPFFRDVDLLAPEHGVDPLPESGFLRQPQEECHGLVGDPVLRIVEVDARRLGRHPLAALGVVREKLSEM